MDNPIDPEIIESACYSRLAEPFMIEQYEKDKQYWAAYNVQPSWRYFGAHNGLFRRIPAVHHEKCGEYDHRRRPWFVAASSGPKDVVLVIDTSGSMGYYEEQFRMAQDAAITVVETLTVGDSFAVVSFSDQASVVGGGSELIRATIENKKRIIDAINGLVPDGGTNFYAAFDVAFNVLGTSMENESTSGCQIAILFMTDGMITSGPGDDEVISLVNRRNGFISSEFERMATVFTYSFGMSADTSTTKKISCSTNGISNHIDDWARGGDLISAMSSYYKMFALGLGEDINRNFTALVEPYRFFSDGNMGTTVSAPVFDRSEENHHQFLGVVAVDSHMYALEQAVGEDSSSLTMLNRFVAASTAYCPKIVLSPCELEALRGENAKCDACNSTNSLMNNSTEIIPECPDKNHHPTNLWNNVDMLGKKYEDIACCQIGGTVPSESCPASTLNTASTLNIGMIVGIAVGMIVSTAVLLLLFLFVEARKRKQASSTKSSLHASVQARKLKQAPLASTLSEDKPSGRQDLREPEIVLPVPVISGSGTLYDGVNIVPPPPFNPIFDTDHGSSSMCSYTDHGSSSMCVPETNTTCGGGE